VSGFGLLGHLGEMLDASAAGGVVRVADVPLHDSVLDLVAQAVYAGGLRSNRDYLLSRLRVAGGRPGEVDQEDPRLLALFDPQTSGGLLIAVATHTHAALLSGLRETGVAGWTVGEVTAGPPGTIVLKG
jgi:selenide, water dikinase